jgi:hypothetical protein
MRVGMAWDDVERNMRLFAPELMPEPRKLEA